MRHSKNTPRLHWRASPELQARARELRRDMTFAERRLWQQLRDEQLGGAHFRRQYAIGQYVVDFICIKAKLVVEVDGDTHAEVVQQIHDAERTQWLNDQKHYRVLRFTNEDVHHRLGAVVAKIEEALKGEPAEPPP